MAGSSSEQTMRARAWLFHAEFKVAEHQQIANTDTNQNFPEDVRQCLIVAIHILLYICKEWNHFFSMQTDLSSLSNGDAVLVTYFILWLTMPSMKAQWVQFRRNSCLTATLGPASPRSIGPASPRDIGQASPWGIGPSTRMDIRSNNRWCAPC